MAPRVLVVDDNPVVRSLIRINLELEGFEVAEAGDGGECLAQLAAAPADLVTLDVLLPHIPDGLAVLRRIRTAPDLAAIPVLVVTAAAQADDERRARSAGADAYLTKPFEPERLLDVVRQQLAA